MLLPQNKDLPPRTKPVSLLVVHTTGRRLTAIAAKNDPQNLAAGAKQWYRSSSTPYYGHVLVAPDLSIAGLCPDDLVAWHTRGLPNYGADWREFAYSTKEKRLVKHGRDPHVVYDWGDARWGAAATPLDLAGGRSVNAVSWAIDLLPQQDGTYTEAQLALAASIVAEKCLHFGLTVDSVYNHSDLDPTNRGIVWKGKKAIGRDWDAGIDDFMAFRSRVQHNLEKRLCSE